MLAGFAAVFGMVAASRAPVAVIGATGNVGRLAVKELVEQGYPVRILQRSAAPAKDSVAASLAAMLGVEPVQGDVNDAASVRLLLQGCSACLALHGARRTRKLSDLWQDAEADPTHSKNINYEGVRTILEAAQASGTCGRVVRITGKGETPWSVLSILTMACPGPSPSRSHSHSHIRSHSRSQTHSHSHSHSPSHSRRRSHIGSRSRSPIPSPRPSQVDLLDPDQRSRLDGQGVEPEPNPNPNPNRNADPKPNPNPG